MARTRMSRLGPPVEFTIRERELSGENLAFLGRAEHVEIRVLNVPRPRRTGPGPGGLISNVNEDPWLTVRPEDYQCRVDVSLTLDGGTARGLCDYLIGADTEDEAERLILSTRESLQTRGIPADLLSDEECLAIARVAAQ